MEHVYVVIIGWGGGGRTTLDDIRGYCVCKGFVILWHLGRFFSSNFDQNLHEYLGSSSVLYYKIMSKLFT